MVSHGYSMQNLRVGCDVVMGKLYEHLKSEEWVVMVWMQRKESSHRAVARKLNCSPTSISREMKQTALRVSLMMRDLRESALGKKIPASAKA